MEEDIKVVYLCDEKACKNCRSDAKECKHTSDIKHAKNFKLDNGVYFEEKQEKEKNITSNYYSIILICSILTTIFLIINLVLLVIW